MGRNILRAVLLFFGAVTLLSCSSANTDSGKFLSKAMQDGVAEIRVCQLALQRSSSLDVKQFAPRMIDDHTRLTREIML
jgi:putative membrane protein